jgi:hypothetical protein
MLCEDAFQTGWDFLAVVFQRFTLTFQNLDFTKGKRRFLLFLISKAEGDIF